MDEHPKRIRTIDSISTMRFVDANTNAGTFTA
jgi:hypothetical protein